MPDAGRNRVFVMETVLITGSNRGMGLEWARQYAKAGWRVHATCRHPEQAVELRQLAVEQSLVSIHRLDVTEQDDVQLLAGILAGSPVDVLVNNAAVYFEHWGRDRLGHINYGDWGATFEVNTLGAMRVSEALIDSIALSERRLIVAITSNMGSIAEILAPNDYAYRSSKAALNAAMKGLSLEVAERGVGVLMLHPGWVRTRMGGEDASLTAEESVREMRRLVEQFNLSQSGRFYRYDGSAMPW
jgi:NAD(P)-dependent dehydrogenase (short-subunit alcohol dehydrogenase family)